MKVVRGGRRRIPHRLYKIQARPSSRASERKKTCALYFLQSRMHADPLEGLPSTLLYAWWLSRRRKRVRKTPCEGDMAQCNQNLEGALSFKHLLILPFFASLRQKRALVHVDLRAGSGKFERGFWSNSHATRQPTIPVHSSKSPDKRKNRRDKAESKTTTTTKSPTRGGHPAPKSPSFLFASRPKKRHSSIQYARRICARGG